MLMQLSVNGEKHEANVEPRLLLVHMIRESAAADRHPHRLRYDPLRRLHRSSWTVRAGEVVHDLRRAGQGKQLMTVEGLEQDGKLHPLQEGFMAEHGLQCGYCTPGMLMTSFAFLQKTPQAQ